MNPRVNNTLITVCVAGLGYVGLPVSFQCLRKGFRVIGYDVNEKIVTQLQSGASHIDDPELVSLVKEQGSRIHFTTDSSLLSQADVVLMCVPTPIDHDKRPDLRAVVGLTKTIASHLQKGQLIVLESTVSPLTLEQVVLPLLQESGLVVGADFFLAHCPERVDPGNTTWTVANIPRVLGGITPDCAEHARRFYSQLLDTTPVVLSSARAAEASKIVENTFRDVNIAFVNELARCFDVIGIDVTEVIKGAATKPFAFLPHYPGCGVGGHCIGVDPFYLIDTAAQNNFDHAFVKLARSINGSMPSYLVKRLLFAVKELGKDISTLTVGILGLAYKPNVDDLRESPALEVLEALQRSNIKHVVFDPHIPSHSTVSTVTELLDRADILILATAHKEFLELDASTLSSAGIVLVADGRNCLDRRALEEAGIAYVGIGTGRVFNAQ